MKSCLKASRFANGPIRSKWNVLIRDFARAGVDRLSLLIHAVLINFNIRVSGTKEDDIASDNLRPVLSVAAVAVFPTRGLQPALDVKLFSRVNIFADYLSHALPSKHGMPLRAVLPLS